MLDAEVRESVARNVLSSVRVLTAWFVPLLLLLAISDYWVLPAPRTPGNYDVRPFVIGLTVVLALVLGGIFHWLRYRPPPLAWANSIAVFVGCCILLRSLAGCMADPQTDRALAVVALIVGASCVLLSRAWLVAYIVLVFVSWYSVAYWSNPAERWSTTLYTTIAAIAMSFVVLHVRRWSYVEMITARVLDRRVSDDLTTRVRLGEVLVRVSARFLSLQHTRFESAVEATLKELGQALGADHAFLCRIEPATQRTTIQYEWAASPVDPRKAVFSTLPTDEFDWFYQRLKSGERTNIALADFSSSEATPEARFLTRLQADAFLAVPLIQGSKTPWGYLGLAQTTRPTLWSADEASLLHVVGDILLSTMERHAAETRVRLSEARFRSLFDSNIIGVFFASVYGKISDANDAFFDITGYQPSDLPLRWDQLTPPEWRSQDEAAVLRLLKYGVDHPWEKEFFRKDGSRVPVLIGGAILSHRRGECAAFVLDLRQRKDAEQKIQELNAALERAARIGTMGEMAAGLAHEIHQPIAAILNYSNGARKRVARGRLSDDDLDGLLSEISAQCERAGSVIRNIRDFVRGLNPERRPVDLNAVVEQSLQLARFDVYHRGVQVETELEPGLPSVLTDPTQLSQILLNLILNAVQAMDGVNGERRLLIRTSFNEAGEVEARVRDTGHGVHPMDRDRLFDQFFTTKSDGMGLGLSIARSIAEDHGGKLELAESCESGSEFVLRLPAIFNGTEPGATVSTKRIGELR